jgi:hypothetical protein
MPESEPRLIRGYLDTLAARLPASVTDELADGLTETYRFHRSRGRRLLGGSPAHQPGGPALDGPDRPDRPHPAPCPGPLTPYKPATIP